MCGGVLRNAKGMASSGGPLRGEVDISGQRTSGHCVRTFNDRPSRGPMTYSHGPNG